MPNYQFDKLEKMLLNDKGELSVPKMERLYYKLQFRKKRLQKLIDGLNAKKDFFALARTVGHKDIYEPLHKPVADFVLDKNFKKKMVLLPRGHFKTTLFTIDHVIFRLIQNYKIKILIFSSTKDKAEGMLASIKNILMNDEIKMFIGDFVGSRVWNKESILVKPAELSLIDNTYSVETAGVDKTVTSKHFDLIIFDDIVSPKNVKTLEQRKKVREVFDEAVDSLLKPDGEVLILGTRWHFDDLYSDIIENDNYENGGEFKILIRKAIENGKPIMPTKYTLRDLKIKEKRNEYLFWANWMNEPRVTKGKPLNPEWLEYYNDEDVDFREIKNKTILIDPAGKKNAWNDHTGIVVAGEYKNKILILDLLKERLDTDEIVDKIKTLADKWKVYEVYIEDAGMQEHLLTYVENKLEKSKIPVEIITLNPKSREKEQRIIALKPYIKAGQILFPKKREFINNNGEVENGIKQLKSEMDEFPLSEKDDLLDALAYTLDVYDLADKEEFYDFSLDKQKKELYNRNERKNQTVENEYEFVALSETQNEIYDQDLGEVIEL